MPFNSNTAAGTVVYTPGAFWSGNVLSNDSSLVSVTDYASILSVTLGKYERIVFNMWIDTQNDADGDLKWKLLTPSSPTSFRARMVLPEVPISGAVTEAVTTASTPPPTPTLRVIVLSVYAVILVVIPATGSVVRG